MNYACKIGLASEGLSLLPSGLKGGGVINTVQGVLKNCTTLISRCMFCEIASDFKCVKVVSQTSMQLSSDTCTYIVCLFSYFFSPPTHQVFKISTCGLTGCVLKFCM